MEIVLKPGLAIINTKGLHSAVIQVGFIAGSRFDEKGDGCLALLTEHLFVKELENASHHPNSPFAFLSEINGLTEREMLWGYIKTAPSQMPEAIDRMMRSIYLDPLDASFFENEKKTISGAALENEHNQYPYDLVFAKTYDLVFSSHPLARSVTGTHNASQTLTMEDVSHHFQTRCRKGRKFIAIACDLDQIDLDTLLKPWENVFTEVATETDMPSLPFPVPNPQTLSLHQDAGIVEMTLTVPIPKSAKVPFWLMDFVRDVLGKSPNSLLFKLVREKYALAYDIYSLCFHYTDGSLFIIYAGISNPENLTKTVERIEEILTHITSYLTEDQLTLYKQAYIAHYWMKSDHLVNFTRSLIATSLTQAPLHPDDLLAHIQSITLQDIEHFVSTYLHPSKLSRVIIQ
jgi:predicted Zn-dependent peptidase